MPPHKTSDYKLSAVKYYLSGSTRKRKPKISGLSRGFKCSKV